MASHGAVGEALRPPLTLARGGDDDDDDDVVIRLSDQGAAAGKKGAAAEDEEEEDVYLRVCFHMAKYAGKLPMPPAEATLRSSAPRAVQNRLAALRGVAPYQYTGCDYAQVLHAMFPRKCIDLTQLCWADEPIALQKDRNLAVFVAACHALPLAAATKPTTSLSVDMLRAVPANIVHHIRVQRWLYDLASRFPPTPTDCNPAAQRAALRSAQFGVPHIHEAETTGDTGNTVLCICCRASFRAAPVAISERIQLLMEEASRAARAAAARKRPRFELVEKAESSDEKDRRAVKSWLNYSKPWKANATRRRDVAAGTSPTALVVGPSDLAIPESVCGEEPEMIPQSLGEQLALLRRDVAALATLLDAVETQAQHALLCDGEVDFAALLTQLQQLPPPRMLSVYGPKQ